MSMPHIAKFQLEVNTSGLVVRVLDLYNFRISPRVICKQPWASC